MNHLMFARHIHLLTNDHNFIFTQNLDERDGTHRQDVFCLTSAVTTGILTF